jgi:hypothetical protein
MKYWFHYVMIKCNHTSSTGVLSFFLKYTCHSDWFSPFLKWFHLRVWKIHSKSFFTCDSLATKFIIGREASGMGTLCNFIVRGLFLCTKRMHDYLVQYFLRNSSMEFLIPVQQVLPLKYKPFYHHRLGSTLSALY